ncbi:cytochrome P450 [Mycena belliarum]|uniref:Cytochrome P450 n=1 Tax=Mycena belliarum TaxID=1033014 RepID=A0AAD6XJV8_9AGAR|nr:cytochrome P450 [Mycena belliae]
MVEPLLASILVASVLIVILTLVWYPAQSGSPPNTFPGPPRLPLVGNLLQVPKKHPWKTFAEWKKTYGDIVFVKIFSRNLIILNSIEAATELFEKRSLIYSERPLRPMAQLCGFGKALLFLPYGETARRTRKLMHAEISQHSVSRHQHLQEREVQRYVQKLSVSSSDTIWEDTRRLAASVILMISHGYEVKGLNDPLVHLAEQVMGYVTLVITPNTFLVDSLPFLRYLPEWFPGAKFQKEARNCRRVLHRLMHEPYLMVQKEMEQGTALPSLVSQNIDGRIDKLEPDERELIMWTAGGLYAGGSHSTVASLMTFILCMVLHPEAQKKAQEELDHVVGHDRLPSFTDRPMLPYIDCVLQELLRWRPVTPLAAHSTLVDDTFQGSVIPAGSVVMANAWAFTHDEKLYSNPEIFDPDRFMSGNLPDPRDFVFGFGRRSCPGQFLFESLLWITISTTLSTLDILPALDNEGQTITPLPEFTSGGVSQPLPFPCRIIPRSAAANELIAYATASWA